MEKVKSPANADRTKNPPSRKHPAPPGTPKFVAAEEAPLLPISPQEIDLPTSAEDQKAKLSNVPAHDETSWTVLLDYAKQEQQHWAAIEENSNDKLYAILAFCLRAYQALITDAKACKAFKDVFAKSGLSQNKRTRLEAKVIRYVFDVNRKKLSAYATVLAVAQTKNVKPYGISDWIRSFGGIENIRRSSTNVAPPLPKAEAIKLAETTLADREEILTLTADATKIKPENGRQFCIAVVRTAQGKPASVVYSISESVGVDAVLSMIGRALHASKQYTQIAEKERQRKGDLNDSIQKAVAA